VPIPSVVCACIPFSLCWTPPRSVVFPVQTGETSHHDSDEPERGLMTRIGEKELERGFASMRSIASSRCDRDVLDDHVVPSVLLRTVVDHDETEGDTAVAMRDAPLASSSCDRSVLTFLPIDSSIHMRRRRHRSTSLSCRSRGLDDVDALERAEHLAGREVTSLCRPR